MKMWGYLKAKIDAKKLNEQFELLDQNKALLKRVSKLYSTNSALHWK